ncbi:Bud site selection protein 7 [Komagataella phaffii CBS 7435]|uniref:Member of the ChAPs family (Chs5p-Arf1p-binding proteins: Bch1p, Bch2p, Bud7p, Chs6p), that forms th n=2 Tax=Komagataella phaffii TaxID=460519 RepID=C4QZS4_KOMPG|nr:Member of the ChAPs family (Chs5p-Arf1p-binding proteins: Bch1p, Bch2p, Bud7p, Chs6p), that forms th [Komagataella phaffii GS115]AOA61939.1 GQ67_00169T0 [Komagataella phaffii]CAH2448753.1 Member of the ChAPs family (Chs5p-Arf1p-binding proteins Bch1p, Bch2p, Bud7p, Chs6p), that forms th [Komagataella phaffii CBS 7435]AOA67470.1 GQ68_01219T0 [Komagataella phaffii GS115]CAY68748.1 Member of the ChAPs family (Chs5p-Arf1p-binding proteins: Bch1p, Bch2p, Bud7p, Chs6p), that forms th [Komagataella
MSYVTQGSIPEVLEKYANQSLEERTNCLPAIQDLGPPDLVQLVKLNHHSHKEISTFFYITGTNVTSSSSVAAVLNSFAMIISESPQLWFGKHKPWRVIQATFCSYNVFSKTDAVVTVHIPGSAESHMVSSTGEKIKETEQLWLETFISSMIRSIITADDDDAEFASIVELRKVNPLLNDESVTLFLEGFEALFWDGQKTGCHANLQLPTLLENYLVDTFFKVLQLTRRFDQGVEIVNRLIEQDESCRVLLAKVYMLSNQEIKAMDIICQGIKINPRDAALLTLQAEICMGKSRHDLAIHAATRAVESSPSEFKCWATLAKIYINVGNFEEALLTLNSCPMVTHKDRYHLKRVFNPLKQDLHLPLPVDVTIDEVTTLNPADVTQEHKTVDASLLNLPAASLKSTFAEAYGLLTEIVHKIGWEELLRYRAKVFVMEHEYKKEKSHSATSSTTLANDATIKAINCGNGQQNGNAVNDDDFRAKRLCERWLDNLFMLLYEDLRVYTMYRAEHMHLTAQQMEFKKTTLEWELIGMVSWRLKHFKEASEAFKYALGLRFSVKACKKLIEFYLNERSRMNQPETSIALNNLNQSTLSIQEILKYRSFLDINLISNLVKLGVWNHRWYAEFSPKLIESLAVVVENGGLIKVENEVKATYFDSQDGVYDLMNEVFKFMKHYDYPGTDN